jgi:hypothetical protein
MQTISKLLCADRSRSGRHVELVSREDIHWWTGWWGVDRKRIIVADEEAGRCLDPEGNGVNLRGGNGGGPSPPSGEQDKQLISSRGEAGNTHGVTGKTGRRVQRDKKDPLCKEYVITVNNTILYVNSNNVS